MNYRLWSVDYDKEVGQYLTEAEAEAAANSLLDSQEHSSIEVQRFEEGLSGRAFYCIFTVEAA